MLRRGALVRCACTHGCWLQLPLCPLRASLFLCSLSLSLALSRIVSHTRSLTRCRPLQEVAALLDRGVYDNDVFAAEGWVSGLKYEDEIIDDLKKRTGGKVWRPH